MMNNCSCYLGGDYCNPTFGEVFNSVHSFLEGYHYCGIPTTITDDTATTLFYLLYAKFGNSPIRSNDSNIFAYRVYKTIFQYGPTWEKRLDIQEALREMSLRDGELFLGSKAIYNHASHDGSAPTTATLTELSYIDSQNTTNYKKSRVEGLASLMALLEKDVTEEFLNKFTKLFSQWLKPDTGIVWFVTQPTEDDGTGGVDDDTTTPPSDDTTGGIDDGITGEDDPNAGI